jgi:hypothetical protein
MVVPDARAKCYCWLEVHITPRCETGAWTQWRVVPIGLALLALRRLGLDGSKFD